MICWYKKWTVPTELQYSVNWICSTLWAFPILGISDYYQDSHSKTYNLFLYNNNQSIKKVLSRNMNIPSVPVIAPSPPYNQRRVASGCWPYPQCQRAISPARRELPRTCLTVEDLRRGDAHARWSIRKKNGRWKKKHFTQPTRYL